MKTLLILDVDGVLIHWDAIHDTPPTETKTGYGDWVYPNKRWFNYYSPQQLADIKTAPFDLYWHTTWCLPHQHPKMLRYFAEVTGFAPTERTLIDLLPTDYKWETGGRLQDEWWKASTIRNVAKFKPEFFQGYDKVLWVDDHLRHYGKDASDMLTETGADKGPEWVLIPCDAGVWDRLSIEYHTERAFNGR